MNKLLVAVVLLVSCGLSSSSWAENRGQKPFQPQEVATLLGEKLSYDISFLWFDRIAQGEISLARGSEPGTYLAILSAKTRGVAAFFTSNRVEIYSTLMEEGPDGLLRPLLQTADTKKDKDGKATHRQTSYTFDFDAKKVTYRKTFNGVERQKTLLAMNANRPIYDFLSAFYNLRLGRLGQLEVGNDIILTSFSRKGPEEIVISRVKGKELKQIGFSDDLVLCKVLMTPDTFKTKSRDVYVGFDPNLRPLLAVVKNVIGLGDVRGKLIQVVEPQQVR